MPESINNAKVVKPLSKTGEEVKTRFTGICSTCNQAMECVQAIRAAQPILFCDMFDDRVEVSREKAVTKKTKEQVAPEASPQLKGLCVNCENRETCMFPKPEGGVWHCEEYC